MTKIHLNYYIYLHWHFAHYDQPSRVAEWLHQNLLIWLALNFLCWKKNNISDPTIIIKILLVPAAISKLKFTLLKFNKTEIRISLKNHTYNF